MMGTQKVETGSAQRPYRPLRRGVGENRAPSNNMPTAHQRSRATGDRAEQKRVLALDPGETTGYVVADYAIRRSGDGVDIVILTPVDEGTWAGLQGFDDHLPVFYDADLAVAEDYIIYPNRAKSHTGDRVYTAQEIGRIKWFAYRHSIELTMQPASMAKQRWPDGRLREKLGRMPPEHICDAWRHLLTYLEKCHDDAYIELASQRG